MNKTNKIIVSIALALVLCTGAALLAQAFFQAFSDNATGNVTVTPPSKAEPNISVYYVEVATEAELIKETKALTYSHGLGESETGVEVDSEKTQTEPKQDSRCIILLTADITLHSDLVVTRDCHIDLGEFTLNTQNYTMTVNHTYSGTFVITNGTLQGNLVTNTPNAVVLIDTEDADNPAVLSHTALQYNPTAVCNGVLSMVCASITNTFPDSHGIYGLLTNSCSLPTYSQCSSLHSGGCCFATGDLDLPYWFFGYEDVKVVYSSKNGKIDATGHVTLPGENEESFIETLSVTVSCGDVTLPAVDFNVHLLHSDDYAWAAAVILTKKLEDCRDSTSGAYKINTEILLPPTLAIGSESIEMTYASNSVTKEGTGTNAKWVFTPTNNEPVDLKINNAVTVQIQGAVTEVEETAHTIANRIINDIVQGGAITINKLGTNSYSTFALDYEQNQYVYDNFKLNAPISFTLSNDLYQAYDIRTLDGVQTIVVQDGKTPEEYGEVQQVYLKSELTILNLTSNVTTPVTVYTPIHCTVKDGASSTNVSEFSQYYHYFNKEFSAKTGGYYTYSDFQFPTAYNNDSPQIKFYALVATTDAGGNTVYTFDGAIELTASNTDQEFSYLKVYKDTINNVWVFDFDQEEIGLEDIDLVIGYSYRFKGSNGEFPDAWTNFAIQTDGFVNQYTKITVAGVIDRGEITNPVLYEYLYKVYHPEDTSYVTSTTGKSYDPDVDYILSNRRGLAKELDLGAVVLPSGQYATYLTTQNGGLKGLQLFTGATKLVARDIFTNYATYLSTPGGLMGPEMNWTTYLAYIRPQLGYIAGMTGLEYLDISNSTSAVNRKIADAYGFDTGWDPIGELTTLTNLSVLHVENNAIYNFDSLANFQSLTEVHLYGNTPNFKLFNDNSFNFLSNVNTAISTAVKDIYGSQGAVAISVFSSLYPNVSVYNDSANPSKPFTPSASDVAGIGALKNIEYQNTVPTGMDITPILEQLPTDIAAYGIAPNENTNALHILDPDAWDGSAGTKTFTNNIQFVLPADEDGDTISGTEADYFILRYTDFVAVEIDIYGKTFGFEYTVDIRLPIQRTANAN